MAGNNCDICGANIHLVGLAHRCIPRVAPIAPEEPAGEVKSKPAIPDPTVGTSPRVARWRDANRERYNVMQREYMRKRRAK